MSSSEKPCVCLRRVAPRVNGGHLQIGGRSPGSEFGDFPSHIADSLRRMFEIFPFFGDGNRRPGSISHCVAGMAVNSVENAPEAQSSLCGLSMAPFVFLARSPW